MLREAAGWNYLVMKLNGSNVVQMSNQREGAAPQLVIPHFNFVIVAAAHKEVPEHALCRIRAS
jgi:hypothetical protein